MRRTNTRKRNKILAKFSNNKILKLIISLSIIIIIILITAIFFIRNFFINKNFENDALSFYDLNETIPFSVKKMVLFSSATANSKNINQSVSSLNISQYCDIGIYLNNLDKENNIIKSIYIDKISISPTELGTPSLYKKNLLDLGKCSFEEKNIIQDNFHYNIINLDKKIDYNNYEMYNDGSTPISLGFFNKNIKENFLTDDKEILYNGSLLKKASIPQISIKCNVSFTINIITNNDEHYICNITVDIPFENNESSIYTDGYVTENIDKSSKFIRIH